MKSCLLQENGISALLGVEFRAIVSRLTLNRCAKVSSETGCGNTEAKAQITIRRRRYIANRKTWHILGGESERTTKLEGRGELQMSHRMQCTDVRDDGWMDERMLRMKC